MAASAAVPDQVVGQHGPVAAREEGADRVLDLLESHPEYYGQMRRTAARLAGGIRAIFARKALPFAVVHDESVVDFKLRAGAPNRNYDDARAADREAHAAYYRAMLARGILLPPSQNEVMFVSTAHTDADVDETLAAIDSYDFALKAMQ